MNRWKLGLLVAVAGGAMLVGSPARAQFCGFGGWGYGGLPYNVYVQDSIPYFALHPPVYYSHIVPRPYGWSPFAYPPGVLTPQRIALPPSTVYNPYVPQRVQQKRMGTKKTAAAPLMIVNPYCQREGAKAPAELAKLPGAPQVVYPLAAAEKRAATGLDR